MQPDGWINGRRRDHGADRWQLPLLESGSLFGIKQGSKVCMRHPSTPPVLFASCRFANAAAASCRAFRHAHAGPLDPSGCRSTRLPSGPLKIAGTTCELTRQNPCDWQLGNSRQLLQETRGSPTPRLTRTVVCNRQAQIQGELPPAARCWVLFDR